MKNAAARQVAAQPLATRSPATTRMALRRSGPLPQRGFAYMALIVFFGISFAIAGAAMLSGAIAQRRNSEEQLIFVGGEFRRAIESYYMAGASMPPGATRYPEKLEDLLADPRSKPLLRHLRQIYPDPLTGEVKWGTVPSPDGKGIMGIYSLSPAKAVKLFGFPTEFKYLEGKKTIAEWKFLYIAPTLQDIEAAAKAIGVTSSSATAAVPAPATPAVPAAPGAPADPTPAAPASPSPSSPAAPANPAAPAPPDKPAVPTKEEQAMIDELNKQLKELEKIIGK